MTSYLVDALLVIIVLLGLWGGTRRGFIMATLLLITLVTSIVLAFAGYPFLAAWLGKHEEGVAGMAVWAQPASFIGVFIVAHLLLGALARRIGMGFKPKLHANAFNRALGLLPGAVNGLLNATVVALILLTAPLGAGVNDAARDSDFAGALAEPAEWVEAQLSPIFNPAIRHTLRSISIPPDSHASIPLNFTIADAKPRPELEARVLELVNEERVKAGLKPLKADPEMTEVARAHSKDMLARGYFSHMTPEGKDLGQRVRTANLRYLTAGENIAFAQSVAAAHRGLMESPGHRANILRPEFGRLGVGVLDGGKHGLMITQNFRN